MNSRCRSRPMRTGRHFSVLMVAIMSSMFSINRLSVGSSEQRRVDGMAAANEPGSGGCGSRLPQNGLWVSSSCCHVKLGKLFKQPMCSISGFFCQRGVCGGTKPRFGCIRTSA
jgi:hypothetical protein